MGGSGTSPCASCKLLRRRCTKNCIFAPYFPADDPQKFFIVHKVFGASNVNKMLQELPEHQRADAVSSLVYEATARMKDPVYGCVGTISYLQNQVSQLQMQLAVAQAEILGIQMQHHQLPSSAAGAAISQVEEDVVHNSILIDDHKFFYGLGHYDQYQYCYGSSSTTAANHRVVKEYCFKMEPLGDYGQYDMVS